MFLYYIDPSFISEQDYYFNFTTVNDGTNGESSHSNQIMCRTKAGCKLIIVLHHFDKKNTRLYVMRDNTSILCVAHVLDLLRFCILPDSIITVCQVF